MDQLSYAPNLLAIAFQVPVALALLDAASV
jgi:hypothetical protein